MFQFLCVFGPAAITFLTVYQLMGKPAVNYFIAAVELIAYAAVDAGVLFLILFPMKKIGFAVNSIGIRELRYGGSAFLVSFAVAIAVGIVWAAIAKRMEIGMQITKKEKDV